LLDGLFEQPAARMTHERFCTSVNPPLYTLQVRLKILAKQLIHMSFLIRRTTMPEVKPYVCVSLIRYLQYKKGLS
jgi:hypothetical protein